MKCPKKAGMFVLAVLAMFALAGGATSLDPAKGGVPGAAPGKPQTQGTEQIHALMAEISVAFEAAADKVSGFVVPIFAEQVVQRARAFPTTP